MPRTTRIAGSFAIVTIAYWAYALLAVPWIEPPIDLHPVDGTTIGGNLPRPPDLVDLQQKQLIGLFPPNAWELKNPKILESDRAKLLFQTYDNHRGDGTVEIHPCTIVFAYEGAAEDEAQRRRQSIILESPGGAVLQFDQPLDLNRAKIGRLVGGRLAGPVIIRSDWKEPGPEDDLWIATSDIRITEQTISTSQPVNFRWGPHFGRGQDMAIKLLAGPPTPGMEGSGPNIAGMESLELRRIERLHLDLGQAPENVSGVLSQNGPEAVSQPRRQTPLPGEKSGNAPVEINCRGPFRFDAVGRVATFRDRVDVMKSNPSGPSDQITCDLLSLYFAQRSNGKPDQAAAKPDPKTAGSLDLVAQRIEARGNPVVVTAPSQKAIARGERLEYDLSAGSLALDGGREVFVQRGSDEIHARSLSYQSAGPGRLGKVVAQGPGWLRGHSADRPDQQLEAFWKDQLRVFPAERNQVISLTGGAELKFRGVGQLQAREIFFWLVEMPPVAKNQQSRLRPDRMLARNDVHMNSPQLSSKVEQLELWFEEGARGPVSGVGERPGTAVPGMPAVATVPVGAAVALPTQQTGRPNNQAAPVEPVLEPPSQREPASRRFEVVGRLLRARVLLDQQQAAVSNLTIEDGVRFSETQTAQPEERPLLIRGDRLEAVDAATPNAAVTVTGQPARFEGRGLGLTGSNINLNRGTNRLWIDGPGQMDLPMSAATMQGQPPAAPGVLTVDWRRRMEFDGRTAQFEESVIAATAQQQLRTETMRVQLQRPIRFSDPNAQEPPQIEEIQCSGGVWMENRSFDPLQQLTSHEQMQVADLAINVQSGALTAGGPGWVNSVRRGSDNPLGGAAGATAGLSSSANGTVGQANRGTLPPMQDQLNCLHVRFQKSITGNTLRHQLTFYEQVQTTYAPVDNWDAMLTTTDPDKLGPNGVVIRCDQLSVIEMLLPVGGRRAIELEASDNTVVEGTTFTARADRITYAEAKDLLILKSNGRSYVELFRQLEPGAPSSKTAAQEIHYWPKSKQIKVIGAQSLEIGQLPNGNGKQ